MGLTRITSDGITDAVIVNADINASAAIAGTKISPSFTSDITITNATPSIDLVDSNNNSDFKIQNANGVFLVYDTTNSASRLTIASDGTLDVNANLDANQGIDVTGNSTFVNGNRTLDLTLADSPSTGNVGCQFRAGASDFIGLAAGGGTGIGLVVNDNNQVLIGKASSRNVGGSTTNSKLQIEGTSTNTSSMSLVNNENSTAAPFVFFGKTRGNSVGESGIVQNGDTLGGLSFIGADSVDTNNRTAEITAVVNGSPANNTIPTDLTFSTSTANAGQLAERMRIHSSGLVTVGNDPSGAATYGGQMVIATTSGGVLTCADTGSGERLRLEGGGALGRIGTDSNHPLTFITNGTSNERMRIGTNGFVAIGTTSTDNPLSIQAMTNARVHFRAITDIQSSVAGAGLALDVLNDGATAVMDLAMRGASVYLLTNDGESVRINRHGFVKMKGDMSSHISADGNDYHEMQADNPNIQILNMKHGSSNGYGIMMQFNHAKSTHWAFRVYDYSTGTSHMFIRTDGDLENTNNSYGSISDVKLKENIVDANSQWNDIKALKVRNFNFKSTTGLPTHKQLGLVAQETEAVCPGIVKTQPDRGQENEDLGTETKSIKYSVLYMKAVKALQEAIVRIETLEAKVAALEAG